MQPPYKYLVIGAGLEGRAIAYDLLQQPDTDEVTLFDRDMKQLEAAKAELGSPLVVTEAGDVTDHALMVNVMRPHDVAISAVPYDFNEDLARAAIEAGTHFCDLGGNPEIVQAEFAMSDEAKERDVTISPDNGITPGALVGPIAHYGHERCTELGLGKPHSLFIHDGGLPQFPDECGPTKYALVFSVHGLINEYIGDCETLRDGKLIQLPGMTEVVQLKFAEPYGFLESAHGSGGMSTLARTLKEWGYANAEYRVLRWPGDPGVPSHWQLFSTMRDAGFFSEEPLDPSRPDVTPRSLTERVLEKILVRDKRDLLIARLEFYTKKGYYQIDMIDLCDEETGHTAMQRTTGYSAAIVARMIATGEITKRGTISQERDIPPKRFVEEWAKRGITITEEWVLDGVRHTEG